MVITTTGVNIYRITDLEYVMTQKFPYSPFVFEQYNKCVALLIYVSTDIHVVMSALAKLFKK